MSKKFSYFLPTLSNILPNREVTLGDIYSLITGDSAELYEEILPDYIQRQSRYLNGKGWEDWTRDIVVTSLQTNTEEVRGHLPNHPDRYKQSKKQRLPSATFGGVFSRRSKETLLESSGYITIDIDHISDSSLSLSELRSTILKDTEIGWRLVFVSPSGDGLKVICETSAEVVDDDSYKRVYESLSYYLSSTYGIEVDKGGKDICRTTLLCYDPDSKYREVVSPFNPNRHPVPVDNTPLREKLHLQDWGDDDGIEEIVRRVERAGRDIAPDYADYIKLVYSFTALGERGREYLHRVCKLSPAYNETNTDKDFNECSKTGKPQSIGTFINMARDNGIDVSNPVDRPQGHRETSIIRTQSPSRIEGFNSEITTPTEVAEQPTREDSYRERYLTIPALGEVANTKREGIETLYKFGESKGKGEYLNLRSGAMTLICGKSSHCKSKFLQNIALQIATQMYHTGEDGAVLFFTYEEELSDVLFQFANIYTNVPGMSQYGTPNTEVIQDYFKTGYLNKATESNREKALPKLEEFKSLYNGGKLRVYYSDLLSQELCEVIRFISSQIKVKAVFVDYVQLLYREGHKRERREEIKDICNDLRTTAIELGIPMVLATQLNRQTPSPTEMSEDNIADSADLTRYANTIVCLWNSYFDNVTGGKETYLNSEEGKRLQERGFRLGEGGQIYAKITKNRGGTPNIDSILKFVGETGYIQDNDDLPQGHREEVVTPQSIAFLD